VSFNLSRHDNLKAVLFVALLLAHAIVSATEFVPDQRVADAWRNLAHRASPSPTIATAGWLDAGGIHRVEARIPPSWFVASTRSGWDVEAVVEYVESLSRAFGRCNIEVARSPLVILENFSGDAEGEVDERTWDSGVHFDNLPKNLAWVVLFADRIKSPFAGASIGGLAVFNRRVAHVIIARHDQFGRTYEPKWTLPHELAHHLLGPEHDPPATPATIMAAHSCSRCTFSVAQCERMREVLSAHPQRDHTAAGNLR